MGLGLNRFGGGAIIDLDKKPVFGEAKRGIHTMSCPYQIDPELKKIARKIPYNRAVIRCANLFQRFSFRVTAVPPSIVNRTIVLPGYQGLAFRVDFFEPSGCREKLPCLLYVHGGAFSYRASAHHKRLACLYAEQVNCRVCFPHYHLTPRYPYPAAYEDAVACYRHLMEQAEALGIEREKIGVAGDSAGASLAALICSRYEQEQLKKPCLQMLIYPLTDSGMQTPSMKQFSDTPLWNARNNRRMWRYYCASLPEEDRYAPSPMHCPLPQQIPDTYLETAEYDCLRDEGLLYAQKLREAGANVAINETKGTFHGYDCAWNTQIALQNIEKRVLFLKKGFYG